MKRQVQVQPAPLAWALCHTNTAALPSQPGCRHTSTAALEHRPVQDRGGATEQQHQWDVNQPKLSTDTATDTICLTRKCYCRALPLLPRAQDGTTLCLYGTELCWGPRAQPTVAVSNELSQWVNQEQACPLLWTISMPPSNTKAPSFPGLWNPRLPWRNSSQLENCRFVFCPFHREACTFITTQTWYFKEAWEGESCLTRRLTLSTQISELSRAAVFGFPCAFRSELRPL